MPADREHLRLARIERAHQFVVIGDRIHGLLIHLLNHITFLQIGAARFLIKGVTYGTFAPDAEGYQFTPKERVAGTDTVGAS